ncbi:MAG: DNA alkylation repair protein [Candidatus Nanoarchaeia archaeon]|nr:DNA alkylation repair protein [Candidatus Nanoarchaeia archaeon]
MLNSIKKDLNKLKNPEKAKLLSNYFKTKEGQYGYGDIFLGLTSEQIKNIAKNYVNINLNDLQELIQSKIHEERMVSLRILVHKFKKNKKEAFDFYLKNTKNINNWDLVDTSAPNIIGNYLIDKNRNILYKLAKSDNLWEKRISIISTFSFIRNNQFEDTLKISKILLKDEHDLIHKAVGWALREIGKKNQKVEEEFLKKYYKEMPRTMLRYAIEKFNTEKRKFYLNKN